MFFTDQGDEQYTVADSITFTLNANDNGDNGENDDENGDTHQHNFKDMATLFTSVASAHAAMALPVSVSIS